MNPNGKVPTIVLDGTPMFESVAIQIASDAAKGAEARLAAIDPPKFEDNEKTFPELLARIDKTIDFLIKTKKDGQFRAFWKTFDESVNLMASGEVVIQSMWSPAVSAVRGKGVPCVYQPLKEGYRAWGGGLSLAKHLQGPQLDAAYDYINWYMSGWVGAFLNRQGYYSAVLDTAKANMTEDEWGFWMEGKPAKGDIKNPQGQVVEKAGAVRDGGSFYDRMGAVACWNAVMDEDRYMVQKWNQFIAA